MGLSGQLLGQRPYENALIEKQKPWWMHLLAGIGNAGGQAGGSVLGSAMSSAMMGGV
jgi:hypothetical protein